MQTDKFSNEQVNNFAICAKHYLNQDNIPESVLKSAADEILEPALKRLKKYERRIELLRLKYAKKTASKHIERDKNNNYQYTEEDYKKLLEEIDRLSAEQVELPTCIVDMKDVPKEGLSWDITRAFEGIIIPKKVRKFEEEEEESSADPD